MTQIEQRILEVLKEHGPQTRRGLQDRCRSNQWDARDFASMFDAMLKNGAVDLVPGDDGEVLCAAAAQEEKSAMSKTAWAWARIRAEQEKVGHKSLGIMVSPISAAWLFGGFEGNYKTRDTIITPTRMGEITFHINDDLEDDELIVL